MVVLNFKPHYQVRILKKTVYYYMASKNHLLTSSNLIQAFSYIINFIQVN